MANTIKVRFEAQGAKALKSAIDQLAVSQTRLNEGNKKAERLQKKLNRELDKYNGTSVLGVRNSRLLSHSFATMRSTLLLASFGFTLVAGSIGKVLKLFGEQEKAILKLNNALGFNTIKLQEQASALQDVTGVGDEVIIQSQAVLASFVRNEDAVSNLTVATLDLSAALGIDLNSSANLIGKTIGSTTNSLSRYGISVTGAANSTERIESLVENVNILFGDTAKVAGSATVGALNKLSASLGDMMEKLGELLVSIGFVTAIDVLTFSFKALGLAVNEALSFIGVNNEQLQKGLGVSEDIVKMHNAEVQSIKSLNDINQVRAKISSLEVEKQEQIEVGLRKVSTAIEDTKESSSGLSLLTGELVYNMDVMLPVTDELSDHLTTTSKAGEDMAEAMEKDVSAAKTLALTDKELIIAKAKLQELMATGLQQLHDEEVSLNNLNVLKGEMNVFDGEQANIGEARNLLQEQFSNGLINEIQLRTKLQDLDAKEINLEKRKQALKDANINKNISNLGKLSGALIQNAEAAANVEFGLAVISAIRSGLATRKNLSDKGLLPPAPQIAGALEIAAGIAVATQIRAQSFEQGGLIGGRRHSQGGTIIEAERGEFIMSRDAVESIGVDNLEAMNTGGGGVTVNITGNVMSEDFVEEELADKIANAVRRGVDFGIS